MNARTIKSQMKKANFDMSEWIVEKAYKSYNIILTTYGLTDNKRQSMTGNEVNDKRKSDNSKIEAMAELFDVIPERSSIRLNTNLAPIT